MKDFSLPAYSGTSLENFRAFATVEGRRMVYRKDTGVKFFSQRTFFSSNLAEALSYAIIRALEFKSEPLVMVGKLPWFQRFNIYRMLPKGEPFPVDEVALLKPDFDLRNIDPLDRGTIKRISECLLLRTDPSQVLKT